MAHTSDAFQGPSCLLNVHTNKKCKNDSWVCCMGTARRQYSSTNNRLHPPRTSVQPLGGCSGEVAARQNE